MNFYEYYDPSEIIEDACLLAAQTLIENGFEVLPLKKGSKEPSSEVHSIAKFRQHPIHAKNVDFFFQGRDVDISIMLRRDMEVLDIDSKNQKGLSEEFLLLLETSNPDLYDKLVISRTPSGGLHIPYYSEIIGGKTAIAQVNATPHPLTIIERLNETNKNYIKCAPSVGYEFIKGSPLEMPSLTGEERNWLSALAASFNKIIIPDVNKGDAGREDSPWSVFNGNNDWSYILEEITQRGWTVEKDLIDRVSIKRPGSNQHSGSIWKDTNMLYLFTSSSEFKPEKGYTPFSIYCHYYHDGNVGLATRKLASEGIGVNIFEEGNFWKIQKKKLKIKYTELMIWLHTVGYRYYENEIVKITDNIVSIIKERDLKAAFIYEIEPEMVDEFFSLVAGIFNEKGGVMSLLRLLEDNFIKDTKTETWLFFKNYAVKVTATDILPMQYKELTGFIWEGCIIERNFYNEDYKGCDAARFVDILGGAKVPDLQKLIGYSISRYKDPLNPKAVVLTEDIDAEEEGESQGGSGKGLLFSFIKQFRKSADFDGKSFKANDPFLYQNVDIDTNIIFIDDVEKNFKFTSLFSILTSSLPVNKKNKGQIIIPFETSPKVFITSNFSVGQMDISSNRRKYEFAVVKHFGLELLPVDEFGRQFFNEWDTKEWYKFDNFISYCCQLYLSDTNRKAIGNVTDNSHERSLINNTSKEFIEYMDGQLQCYFFDFAPNNLKTVSGNINGVYTTNAVDYKAWKENMASYNPNKDLFIVFPKAEFYTKMMERLKIKGLTSTRLTQWLKKWADSRKVELNTRYQHGTSFERANLIMDFPDKNNAEIDVEVPF